MHAERIAEFSTFIESAKAMLESRDIPTTSPKRNNPQPAGVTLFENFIREATPIVIGQVRDTLRMHSERLNQICRWLVPEGCDILTAAGLNRDEVRYTRLIAWLLWPEQRPDLALRLQRAWLSALGQSDIAAKLTKAAEPKTELFDADGGRADLVLSFESPDFILIVEAKIDAEEYGTDDGGWQTELYPSSVRRRLHLPDHHPGIMVFLTPDGREAHARDAIMTTYELLTTVVANTLSPDEVDPDLRWAFAAVITHLLTHTTPNGTDRMEAFRRYAAHRHEDILPDQLLKDLPFYGPLCRTLRTGEHT